MKRVMFALLVAAAFGWSSSVGPFTVNQVSVISGCSAGSDNTSAIAIQVTNSSGQLQGTQFLVQSSSPIFNTAFELARNAIATGKQLKFEVLSSGTETVNYSFTAQWSAGTCYTQAFYNVRSVVGLP